MRLTRQAIEEGAMPPRGYGLAYRDLLSNYGVYYPVPVNLIVRAAHWFRHWYWVLAARADWMPLPYEHLRAKWMHEGAKACDERLVRAIVWEYLEDQRRKRERERG